MSRSLGDTVASQVGVIPIPGNFLSFIYQIFIYFNEEFIYKKILYY